MDGQLSVKFCLIGNIIHSSEIQNIIEIVSKNHQRRQKLRNILKKLFYKK